MGSIAYRDIGGTTVELSDHEGYVLHESTVPNAYIPQQGHWLGYWSSDVDGTFTGRHQVACDCGWRGRIHTIPDATTAYGLAEAVEEQLMDLEWGHHIDELVAAMRAEADNPPAYGTAERVCFELLAARRHGAHLPYSVTGALDEWQREHERKMAVAS